MTSLLKGMQQRRKFNRTGNRQRKPIRPLLGRRGGPLSLRHAARQSQRMHARRTGLRGL